MIVPAMLLALMISVGCTSRKVAESKATTRPEATTMASETPVATTESAPVATTPTAMTSPGEDPIPLDPAVRTGTLSNGLTYYVRQNQKPENIAELRLAVNAGSMQENPDQVGLAHFVEHMCFNGTENFPKSELVDYLEGIGMRFGAHLNAYTSFDETVYMLRLPTDDQDKFDKGFQILEDWATAVTFDPEEIDKERGVVISEWRTRLGGNYRMLEQVYPVMFFDSRYAKRLPIGTRENLETFEHESLIQYYEDWYRPDLMSVIAVGDFDVDEMEAQIREIFGAIPSKEGPEKIEFEVPNHEDTKVVVVSDPEATFNSVEFLFKHDYQSVKTREDYHRDLTYDLVSSMLRDRLNEIEQQENPPFSNASGYYGQMVRTKDQFGLSAIVADSMVLDGLNALYTESVRAARFGFTDTEVARAKSSILTRMEREFRERSKTESRRLAMRYVQHFLTDNAVPGIEARLAMAKEILPEIGSQEVNDAMKFFMDTDAKVITVTGNESGDFPFPSEADIMAAIESVSEVELEPYEDNLSDAPLMSDIPTPGQVVSVSQEEEIGVTEIVFENGVKVVLKPTEFKNDEISMEAFSPGGLSLVKDENYVDGSLAVQAVITGGVGGYDNIQLQKYMSDKVVNLSPYIADLEEGMKGSCSAQDFETFLQLVHLYVMSPRLDEAAFNSFRTRMSAIYANLLNTPDIFFQLAVPKALYGDHPRKDASLIFEGMNDIDFDVASGIYQDRFEDMGDFTFVFVGNFDPEEITPMLATYLGTLPSDGRKESFKDLGIRRVEGEVEKTFEKGTEPKSQVNLVFHGDMEWSSENRYLLQSTVEVLRIMLRENLREDKGGVYGVGIRGSSDKYPVETYSVTINFTCDPADVDTLIDACHEEVARLQEEGPSEQNLSKVKETQKNSIDEGLQENDYWMNQLVFAYQYELDPSRILVQKEKIDALEGREIQELARMLFANNYAKFVMVPEPSEEEGDE